MLPMGHRSSVSATWTIHPSIPCLHLLSWIDSMFWGYFLCGWVGWRAAVGGLPSLWGWWQPGGKSLGCLRVVESSLCLEQKLGLQPVHQLSLEGTRYALASWPKHAKRLKLELTAALCCDLCTAGRRPIQQRCNPLRHGIFDDRQRSER